MEITGDRKRTETVTQDIKTRVLQLYRRRLENDPTVSESTIRALLEDQRESDFGDDDELLTDIIDAKGDDA